MIRKCLKLIKPQSRRRLVLKVNMNSIPKMLRKQEHVIEIFKKNGQKIWFYFKQINVVVRINWLIVIRNGRIVWKVV